MSAASQTQRQEQQLSLKEAALGGGQRALQSKERAKQDSSLLELGPHEVKSWQKLVRKEAPREGRINGMFLMGPSHGTARGQRG